VTVLLAVVIGTLYAAGLYLVMRRSIVKLVLGLALLAHAANLLIFTLGRLTRGGTPVVTKGEEALVAPFPDPVPQALVLTAIVIGFAVQAFAIVLVKRAHRETGTDDLDSMRATDREPSA
jgi:multicomponent Na+:H+ antiporter subunit C